MGFFAQFAVRETKSAFLCLLPVGSQFLETTAIYACEQLVTIKKKKKKKKKKNTW